MKTDEWTGGVLDRLAEVRKGCPQMRFGQILATIGLLGEDETDHSLWDIEDTEFAAAPCCVHQGEYGLRPKRRAITQSWGGAPGYGESRPSAKRDQTPGCATSKSAVGDSFAAAADE